ncbi:MAG: hypothetical protein ACXWSC_12210 [Bdellovibrionota bacterium]
MKKILCLLLACTPALALAAPGKRTTRESASTEERSAPEIKYSVGASADLQGQYFPDPLSPQVKQAFGIANGELLGTLKVGHTFLARFRPTGHVDPNNPTKSEQSWYDLPEGYIQLKGNVAEGTAATLQLGYNTFTWGVTDGYNPVDVVSARRYSDPLNSEKLGAFSALGRIDLGWVLAEGIFIPWQRSSILPGDHSRWLPREIGGDIQTGGTLFHPPTVPVYTFVPPVSYDAALQNNLGARLSSHFLGMDAAAYYFDGASSIPAVAYTLDGTVIRTDANFFPLEISANPLIVLKPIYNRVTMAGGSAVFPIWELLIRGELAVTNAYRKNSSAITEQNTETVVEVEHTFTGEKSTLTTIGLLSWADPQDNGVSTTSTPSLTRLFDRAGGGGVRWQPTEAFSGEAFAVFDVKRGGSLYKGQLSYKLSDAFKIYSGGEVFNGQTTQPTGVYRKNGRVIAGLKVSI